MPRLNKADSSLRNVILGKAPLKTKLEALAGMESPSETFLLALVSSQDTHPKLKTKAADRLTQVRHRREVDRILAEETARLANRVPVRRTDKPKPDTPALALPLAESLAETIKTEAPISSREPLTRTENLMSYGAEKRRQVFPEPTPASGFERESERRQYHAIFSRRFGRERWNPSRDPALRQLCNLSDLAEIDAAFSEARRKIETGKSFDNALCGDERNILRDWISTPGKGVDGLGRKTAEGQIADALWDELEAFALTVKNLPTNED